MGNCTSFPKGMGEEGTAPPPEQPKEEITSAPQEGEVKAELEVEKNVVEAKEDDEKVVDDKHADEEGEKKPTDSTAKSLEEDASISTSDNVPDQVKDSAAAAESSEVAPPSTSTTEKPDQEEIHEKEKPVAVAVAVAEVAKEESK